MTAAAHHDGPQAKDLIKADHRVATGHFTTATSTNLFKRPLSVASMLNVTGMPVGRQPDSELASGSVRPTREWTDRRLGAEPKVAELRTDPCVRGESP